MGDLRAGTSVAGNNIALQGAIMRALPTTSRIYLVFSLTVSMAVAAVIASVGESRAQADLNLQTQSEIIAAPFSLRDPKRVDVERAATRSRDCPEDVICPETAFGVDPTKLGQPTSVRFTFPFYGTYETNVFKSNTIVQPDTSYGFGGGWSVVTGVGPERPFDLVALGAGSSSQRYNSFPSQSSDVATLQAFYQFFLGAYRADGSSVFPTPGSAVPSPGGIPSAGMATIDTIAVGVVNLTSFAPFYSKEKGDFFTPQISLARQNINLGDPNGCVTASGTRNFCYFANVSITPAQTFSDVTTQVNTSVAVAGSIGARIDHTNLTAQLASTVTGKGYEYFPGGREDLLVQIGPNLQYGINSCFNASLSVTYYRNYSTVNAAAWNGFIVQPTLNVIFPVEPPLDKVKGCG
jgi:hypothetical protein